MLTAVNMTIWNGDAKRRGEKLEIEDLLRDASEAGYDGVELNDPIGKFGSVEATREALARYDLKLAALFASCTYNPWEPNIEDYKRRLEEAVTMGHDLICVCGGFMCNARRNTYALDYDMFASSIGPMVDYAAERGLTLAYHPHRGCVVETLDETQEILHRVPGLRICIDTGHLEACGDDCIAFIRTLREKIVYTHIKDYHWGDDNFAVLGKGDGRLDIAACVEELRKVGYDGWLTVELDRKWQDNDPSALEYARINRRYLAERCGMEMREAVAV